MQQLLLNSEYTAKFPTTRYQGSKLKYIDWIWKCIRDIPSETVLDAFGGTGAFAYMMKQRGKTVIYNDLLKFNLTIGKAIIENDCEIITQEELTHLLKRHPQKKYPTFIEETFHDIYFTDEENVWLDTVVSNIMDIDHPYKQAIAFFAIFQSCIIKRPYNLFHRKNLYMRTQDVKRSFGNKITWDTPFEVHFRNFIHEANQAVFSNGKKNQSIQYDVFSVPGKYDVVYIDPPYVSSNGVGVDYLEFYHFLEGLVNYEQWSTLIEDKSKHKKMKKRFPPDWTNANSITDSFKKLIDHYQESTLIISYRSDGIPSIRQIEEMLINKGKKVITHESHEMKYVLSKKQSSEILIIGQ